MGVLNIQMALKATAVAWVLMCISHTAPSYAATVRWTGDAGDQEVTTKGNWSTGKLPKKYDTVIFSQLGSEAIVHSKNTNISWGDIAQGTSGNATSIILSNGRINLKDSWNMGVTASDNHQLSIAGGKLVVGDTLSVGTDNESSGNILTVSAGQLSIKDNLEVGSNGSDGNSLMLSGGTVGTQKDIVIGLNSDGNSAVITGGIISAGDNLFIGQGGANNSFSFRDGALNARTGSLDGILARTKMSALKPAGSTTLTVKNDFSVGNDSTDSTANLLGGEVNIGKNLILGEGTAIDSIINIDNSAVNVKRSLLLGNSEQTANNTLNLHSGSLSVQKGIIGSSGGDNAVVNVNGGLLEVRQELKIGDHELATNSKLNVDGGTVNVEDELIVGGDSNIQKTNNAEVNIKSGVVDIGTHLEIGSDKYSDGVVVQSGGALRVGTRNPADLNIGTGENASGSYSITEGILSVTDTIEVGEQSGKQDTASFNVMGTGNIDIDADELIINDGAVFNLSNENSTINVASDFILEEGSTFNQDIFTSVTTDLFEIDNALDNFNESNLLSLDNGWDAADTNGFIPLIYHNSYTYSGSSDPVGRIIVSPDSNTSYQVVIISSYTEFDALGLQILSESIPEPSTLILFSFGICLFIFKRKDLIQLDS